LSGGVSINMPPQGSGAKAADQSRLLFDGTVDEIAWPAWLRKLDSTDESYRH
jgi:hypothetical protein